jgi:hypothetical protein
MPLDTRLKTAPISRESSRLARNGQLTITHTRYASIFFLYTFRYRHRIEAAVDETRFDDLARQFASSTSRRRILRSVVAMAGAAIGLSYSGEADAAIRRSIGEICRKNGDCASSNCGPKDATGRRRCICSTALDCPPIANGNQCLAATCSPAGVCGTETTVGAPCDDGNLCTVDDVCQANGSCKGTHKACDDNNACTKDSCDLNTGNCVNTPITCDDGNACTVDTCDPVLGCIFTQVACDDGNVCTVDTCDPISGCVNTPIECGSVSDGNGGEVCCGGCTSAAPCCTNGACGACPSCACPHGAPLVTLADSSTRYLLGGGVCISPCTSNDDCECGEVCVATFQYCLAGLPATDCQGSSGGNLGPGSYCANLTFCTPQG